MAVGGRDLIDPLKPSAREEVRWKGALDELIDRRLVEAVGSKGETFRLTRLGYEVGDEVN